MDIKLFMHITLSHDCSYVLHWSLKGHPTVICWNRLLIQTRNIKAMRDAMK